ncbi:MAG: hypothetical protein MMC23_006122 [Stictis urceolatum]|nr:hypothetical protein [Stictis urceolata]
MASEPPKNHVLRIPRSDTENQDNFVIVNAIPSGENSEDVTIEGTEGETPYFANFTASQLLSARDPKCPLSEADWTSTILHTLLPHIHPSPSPPSSSHPHTSHSTSPSPSPALSLLSTPTSTSLTLTLRHSHASGITRRLGTLSLRSDPDHEINFLDWASTAVLYADHLTRERDAAEAKKREYEAAVGKLAGQMRDLVREKEESEKRLLGAAVELLNAKKAKVRGLMRARGLEGERGVVKRGVRSEIKQEEEEEDVGKVSGTGKGKERSAAASRKGKRKQVEEDGLPDEIAGSQDSESGFETGGKRTPDRSEDEDEETGEEDEEEEPRPRRKLGTIGGGKAPASKDKDSKGLEEKPLREQPSKKAQTQADTQHSIRTRARASKSPGTSEKPKTRRGAASQSVGKDVPMDDGGVGGGTLDDDAETESDDEL